MKTLISFLALGLFTLLPHRASAVDDYTLFKATVSLTVTKVIPSDFVNNIFSDVAVSKTLSTADVVNLALGRPLGTKVTSTLAVAVFVEGPGNVATPKTKLVVYDGTAQGAQKIAATVATLTGLNYEATTPVKAASKGQGIVGVQIVETTTGQDPANNKFFSSTLRGAGMGKAVASASAGLLSSLSLTATGLAGPLHVKFTTATKPVDEFDGIVVKSKFSVSGKPLDNVSF
jgi:hypothetical protein